MKLGFVLLALFFVSNKSIAINKPPLPVPTVIISGQTTPTDLSRIASLKIKEIQKLIGRKLTLKEKISFTILKQQVKKKGAKAVEKEIRDNGKTSFIIGLIALIGLFVPGLGLLSLPLAIIAIIVGNKAKKTDPTNRKARTGIILGWITVGLLVIVASIVVLVLAFPIA